MISVNLVLDTRRKKKDNTFPLKIRIIHDRKPFELSLGYSLLEKDWDQQKQRVKTSCKSIENINRLNSFLSKEKQRIGDILLRLQDERKLATLSQGDLKRILANKNAEIMTLAYGNGVILQMQKANKFGNARVYESMLRSIQNFQKGKDIPLNQITYSWLKKYEAWFLSKGNTVNGLSVNMRTLRALLNRAIKERIITKDQYPFADYSIKRASTRKRAISLTDLKKIKEFHPGTKRQAWAQDCFMLSFYLMGASFVDLAFLQVKNIVGGRIEYQRRKTGRLHSIPMSAPLQKILDRYLPGKDKDDFILNVIKSKEPEQQLKDVRYGLSQLNNLLKKIGEACGIESVLTSYVARHSYATIAKYKGVPTAVISEALGHRSEEVTQIYLDSFDKEVMDRYHNLVIE
jgi:integrase